MNWEVLCRAWHSTHCTTRLLEQHAAASPVLALNVNCASFSLTVDVATSSSLSVLYREQNGLQQQHMA